jgi:hypothetical protein
VCRIRAAQPQRARRRQKRSGATECHGRAAASNSIVPGLLVLVTARLFVDFLIALPVWTLAFRGSSFYSIHMRLPP